MSVIIDLDVIEIIRKFHDRRANNQKSVFALALGEMQGFSTYHIKDVHLRYLEHNNSDDKNINDNEKEKVRYFLFIYSLNNSVKRSFKCLKYIRKIILPILYLVE